MTPAMFDTDALLDTVERLIDVLDSEIDLLSAMKASEIGHLQPTKSMLIDSYERLTAALQAEDADLAAVDPDARKALCEAAARLTHSCRRNELALRAVNTANERLMRAIVEEVRRQQTDASIYTIDGAVTLDGGAAPLSVRIDEQL